MSEASLFLKLTCVDAAARDGLGATLKGEGEAPAPWDELPVADEVQSLRTKGLSVLFSDALERPEAMAVVDRLSRAPQVAALDACWYDSEGDYSVWRKVGDAAALVCRAGGSDEQDERLAWKSPKTVLRLTAKLEPGAVLKPQPVSAANQPPSGPRVVTCADLDDSAWPVDDPGWLAQREAEWHKVLQARRILKDHDPFKRKHDKYHKELFFTGRVNLTAKEAREVFGYKLWLFEMGYHPSPSREVFLSIARRHPEGLSLRDFFVYDSEELATDYGVFGGREEMIVKTLAPAGAKYFQPTPYRAPYVLEGDTLDGSADGLNIVPSGLTKRAMLSACLGDTAAIFTRRDHNCYAPGRYLWDFFDRHYGPDAGDWAKEALRDNSLLPFLVTFEYNEHFVNAKYPETLALAQQLKRRFEEGRFSSLLLAEWQETHLRFERGEFNKYYQLWWDRMKADK